MPALISGTQALGEPRYPSLKGIMAARSKEITTLSLADLGIDRGDGRRRGRHDPGRRLAGAGGPGRDPGRPRAGRRGRPPGRRLPRRAEAHLMAGDLGPSARSPPTARWPSISTEVATLARPLGAGRGRAGHRASSSAPVAGRAAAELAALRAAGPGRHRTRDRGPRRGHDRGARASPRSSASTSRSVVLLGAGPEGRDLAGALSALTGLGVLANATAVSWTGGRPGRRAQRVRRQAHHESALDRRARHRHGPPERGDRRAGGERRRGRADAPPASRRAGPAVRDRRSRSTPRRRAAPIEEARIIVAGGRGVGGPGRLRAASRTSPTRSAAPSARPGPRSTRAGSRTASRSARPARS